MAVTVRDFEERDYPRLCDIRAANDPQAAVTVDVLRYGDRVPEPHVRLVQLTAEMDQVGAVGFGRLIHAWWNFHPRQYQLRVDVDRRWQQHGIGSALLDRLIRQLDDWNAQLVRTEVAVDHERGTAFLEHRGFVERRRRWELSLDVSHADLSTLESASARAAESGVAITTYAVERDRRAEERFRRQLYELEFIIAQDEPGSDGSGAGMAFERFCQLELDAPDALPEAHFIASVGDRPVGVSRLSRDLRHPAVALQGFTGVDPALRGKGIAQMLKMRTIAFAREHGYRQLRTANDQSNAPMLSVNERVGYVRDRPLIVYERRLVS